MADTVYARTFSDPERVALGISDKALVIGPLETSLCGHGHGHKFRYEWPRGSAGPKDGELVILENKCVDCALLFALQPGRRRI